MSLQLARSPRAGPHWKLTNNWLVEGFKMQVSFTVEQGEAKKENKVKHLDYTNVSGDTDLPGK